MKWDELVAELEPVRRRIAALPAAEQEAAALLVGEAVAAELLRRAREEPSIVRRIFVAEPVDEAER